MGAMTPHSDRLTFFRRLLLGAAAIALPSMGVLGGTVAGVTAAAASAAAASAEPAGTGASAFAHVSGTDTSTSAEDSATAASAPANASGANRGTPRLMRVGRIKLVRCGPGPRYCGRIDRPLDPAGAISGQISIYFEFYPHTAAGPSAGTLVATEGGPGYPATESRGDYLALFGPLRDGRDIVLMDNRGTGKSGAIDCPELQSAAQWTVTLVGRCGASLGERSALYSTAYAADDLAAILEMLGAGPIDLYGDSYGTYFEQVFAVRHPHALRSVVLDGAYALNGPDYAWYPTYAPAMRAKFDLACRRSAACSRLPGTSLEHIQPVLEELRRAPFSARAYDDDGRERDFQADASRLAIVMFGSAPALATIKELDAAARAFQADDRAPLLRLIAETLSGVDSRDPAADPGKWSAGLAAAVMCQDPPQIFDMRLPPPQRAADRDRVLAARRRSLPDTYAPFTIDEYRGMPLDYSFLDQCAEWPVAPPGHPASQVVPPHAVYPDAPALVVSGDLDNMTTVADGAAAARAFPHGRQVIIVNGLHVNALPRSRSPCGAELVRHFIETLEVADSRTSDARCAAEVPPVRLVASFVRRAGELEPAQALASNQASDGELRFASAAVLTAGDVVTRAALSSSGHGVGLRGGRFTVAEQNGIQVVTLDAVRWTVDLAVSGTLEKTLGPASRVRAHLTLARTDPIDGVVHIESHDGALDIAWDDDAADAVAEVSGTLSGARVAARMPAP
jgi:pimeloyl-ACP methyl ester carboxylesterase